LTLRDCYLDADHIVVFTRTGGGNRDFYENERGCRATYPHYFEPGSSDPPSGPWNDDRRRHPLFDYDREDEFDCTFALFYVKFPEEQTAVLKELAEATGQPETLKQKTDRVLEAIKNERASQMSEPKRDKNEASEKELETELGNLIDAYEGLTVPQILGVLERIKFDLLASGRYGSNKQEQPPPAKKSGS
jgi:hypothetical protein